MKLSIYNFVFKQLLNCVSNLAQRDPTVEVRRAAILLIHLTLKGLKTDALKVIIFPYLNLKKRILKKNFLDLGTDYQGLVSNIKARCIQR